MAAVQAPSFGLLLKRYRTAAGLTQEELAEQAGLSPKSIGDLETGRRKTPRKDTLALLAGALHLSTPERAALEATARRLPPDMSSDILASAPILVARQMEPSRIERLPTQAGAQQHPALVAHTGVPIGGFLGATPQSPLVGREVELAALLMGVGAVMEGSGLLVTIAGEPGIGKTRLAQELAHASRDQGFLVATGRCYEPHRAAPYYPFLEALSSLYGAAPEPARAEIQGRWPSLLRLLPDQPLATPPEAGTNPQEEQQRLFWAVTGFLQALSQAAPVALLLDDLHWADDASLALLQHLARHTRANRILLLGTYRDVDVGRQHPLARALRDLEREHLMERIAVHRLGLEGTARLIACMLGQDVSGEVAGLVHRHTDGHPLFVQEVLRALIERGDVYWENGHWVCKELAVIEVPESVRATIADRASRLSAAAQEVLREASVLGQVFTFEDLQAMVIGERSEDALDAALEETLAAGLVQEASDGYVFNHALTQQTLYLELSVRRRRKLHLAVGDALERLPERLRERRAAELSWHFCSGGALARALPYAMCAGDAAAALYAAGEAEKHYRTALELARMLDDRTGEARALEKLGLLLWLLARFDVGAEALERAADGYRALGDVEGETRAVGLLGMLFFTAAPLEGAARVQALLARAETREPSTPLASLYASLALNLLIAGRYHETVATAERGAAVARAVGDARMCTWAETTRGAALAWQGHLTEARPIFEEAIAVAEATHDTFGLLAALHFLGGLCAATGDFAASMDSYGRALDLAERLGARSRISAQMANLAEVLFYLGDWPRTHKYAVRAMEIARAPGPGRTISSFHYANALRRLARIRSALGAWEEAVPYVEESVALAERIPYPEGVRNGQRMLAEHDLLLGRPKVALARLEPLMEGADQEELGVARLLPYLARAHAELGDLATAEHMLRAGIAQARVQQHRLALVDLLMVYGMVLGMQSMKGMQERQDKWEEAARTFEEAIALARSMTYPFAEGRVLYEQGRMHRDAEELPSARARLEEARAIFRRLGAHPDAERVERALAELGPF
jgi:tetratricopeptide (TPR) repeat protein/transcriptional regulator with XRE-family HTH domain